MILIKILTLNIRRYKADWHKLVNAPQGNQAEIAKAQRMLDEYERFLFLTTFQVPDLTSSLFRVQAAFEQAQQREDEARKDEADSKKAAAEAARAAEDARAAQRELEAALAVLKVFSKLLKSLNNYSNSIQLGTRRCVCTKDRRTYSKD